MSTIFSVNIIVLLVFLVASLIPIALLVVLQVWLCKREIKWLGLILPALSLLTSLVLVIGIAAFGIGGSGATQITDENGHVIQYEEFEGQFHQTGITPGAMAAVGGFFLVCNIPTVVFGGIWLHYKNRKDFQKDLKRMKIEDLE